MSVTSASMLRTSTERNAESALASLLQDTNTLRASGVEISSLKAHIYCQEFDKGPPSIRIVLTLPSGAILYGACISTVALDTAPEQQIEHWMNKVAEFGVTDFCHRCGASYDPSAAGLWLGAAIKPPLA